MNLRSKISQKSCTAIWFFDHSVCLLLFWRLNLQMMMAQSATSQKNMYLHSVLVCNVCLFWHCKLRTKSHNWSHLGTLLAQFSNNPTKLLLESDIPIVCYSSLQYCVTVFEKRQGVLILGILLLH